MAGLKLMLEPGDKILMGDDTIISVRDNRQASTDTDRRTARGRQAQAHQVRPGQDVPSRRKRKNKGA